MLNRRPEAVDLARAAGLGDRVVHPATIAANLWTRGAMRPMPPTLMGVPTETKLLAASGVISKPGLARVAVEPALPATRLGDQDVSVGWLVEERFGREVVDRLVEPLLGRRLRRARPRAVGPRHRAPGRRAARPGQVDDASGRRGEVRHVRRTRLRRARRWPRPAAGGRRRKRRRSTSAPARPSAASPRRPTAGGTSWSARPATPSSAARRRRGARHAGATHRPAARRRRSRGGARAGGDRLRLHRHRHARLPRAGHAGHGGIRLPGAAGRRRGRSRRRPTRSPSGTGSATPAAGRTTATTSS